MMTEKRFKLVDRNGIYQILDLHKKGRHILTGEENVELLNTLHEENEQLRVLLKEAEDEIKTLKQNNKGLMESLVEHESED